MALNVVQVRNLREPGRYADGGGLYLYIQSTGSKSWVARLGTRAKRWDIGLGSVRDVSLAEAREECARLRKLVRNGQDPLEAKRQQQRQPLTFEAAARRTHADLSPGWRNARHRKQWLQSLEASAFPAIGRMPVERVAASDIAALLAPSWLSSPETSRRVRQRIASVLDWAHANGLRSMPAPTAKFIGQLLPMHGPDKRPGQRHYAAMPYEDVPQLVASIRAATPTMARLALQFTILTAARSGEVRGARWEEFDLEAGLWTVPADRMKANREHIVPLSPAALDLLRPLHDARTGDLVFPGRAGGPMSDMTLTKSLRDMGVARFTVHGFRSSFRDWAAERGFPGDVAESALAHVPRSQVERAYKRTAFLEQRRQMMAQWAAHLAARPSTVRNIGEARRAATGSP